VRRVVIAASVLTGLLTGAGCGGGSDAPGQPAAAPNTAVTPTTTVVAVVRDVLGSDVDPPGAPGRTVTLVRYTIAPGAQLPAHIHPGVQVASIQAGSLTYTVVSGTATIRRSTGAAEAVTGPATVTLGPGDAVTERGDMVHFGANTTADPLVILATLLTETGRELAVPA